MLEEWVHPTSSEEGLLAWQVCCVEARKENSERQTERRGRASLLAGKSLMHHSHIVHARHDGTTECQNYPFFVPLKTEWFFFFETTILFFKGVESSSSASVDIFW